MVDVRVQVAPGAQEAECVSGEPRALMSLLSP